MNIFLIKTKEELQEKKYTEDQIIDFLFCHLGQFRDSKEAIGKCLDYVFSPQPGKGGFVVIAEEEQKPVGMVIINHTGMQGYIPENILVYIAVDSAMRNKGIGRKLLEETAKNCKGDIKLHVEYENPAKRLYERFGFTTKYAEMRYKNDG